MVKLKNRSGQMRVYNLTHAFYCGEECFCRTTRTQQVAKTSNGQQGYKQFLHLVPAVLTILVNEVVEVRESALRVPEIRRDVEARLLAVVAEPKPAPAPSSVPVPPPAPPSPAPDASGEGSSHARGSRPRTR